MLLQQYVPTMTSADTAATMQVEAQRCPRPMVKAKDRRLKGQSPHSRKCSWLDPTQNAYLKNAWVVKPQVRQAQF
jgi:hypothetical protein